MTNNRFSAVQLTLLSVMVALILENLLNQLATDGSQTTLQWLQAALIATTVITLWSGFALILTVSDRKPAPVDFIYPFGLLVTLTLAANSLAPTKQLTYFAFIALGGVFSIWALYAELKYTRSEPDAQSQGLSRAITLQGIDVVIALLAMLLLAIAPAAQTLVGIMIATGIAVQIVASVGTLQGWRFVASSEGPPPV